MTSVAADDPQTAKARLAASWDLFRAGIERLFRPVRPQATPALQLLPGWPERFAVGTVALALIIAGMAYVDPVVQRTQSYVTGGWATFFQIVTDVGKSGWLLWPTGIAILLISAVMPPVRSFADRVVLALMARISFVFVAVAGSGLIIAIVKRLIGRGRPRYFPEYGSLHFDLTAWKASYASFPSGHSQTAFAIAVAFACLAPRWRNWLLAAAALVAFSRVAIDAHYFTDIIVGSAWGAWFTIMTREWYARRGLVFTADASRRPIPMPMRRLRQAGASLGKRLRGR